MIVKLDSDYYRAIYSPQCGDSKTCLNLAFYKKRNAGETGEFKDPNKGKFKRVKTENGTDYYWVTDEKEWRAWKKSQKDERDRLNKERSR